MHRDDQTIFALSSGRPPSAISLVRVSGAQAGAILLKLAGKIPEPRRAMRALLRAANQEPIDDAVVLWFPSPASATGEDVAEFHLHGGRAILAALFDALAAFENTRAAEPGEFTRRAFENGKLDLTEAEGLDDLIHADTEQQRKQAVRQLTGMLGDKARDWRRQIIDASALVEAGIDFSDEGDVPQELMSSARERMSRLLGEIESVLAAQGRSERLREGLVVTIAGPPNAGKSTLINQFARRDVAIVSPHAGTTRDVIEVQLDLGGYPVTMIDTAGIRDATDPVEQEGVRRALARASDADLVLWVTEDGSASPTSDSAVPTWEVQNKIDTFSREAGENGLKIVAANQGPIRGRLPQHVLRRFSISAERGDGLGELTNAIIGFTAEHFGSGGEVALITRRRHRVLLIETVMHLQRGLADPLRAEEFVAEDLRGAATALGRLLGRVGAEDILSSIFSTFCVGK